MNAVNFNEGADPMAKKRCGAAALLVFSLTMGLTVFSSDLPAATKQGTFQFFLGNYTINEPLFKSIYQNGGRILGILLSANLVFNFDFYFEIKEFYKSGTLTYSKEQTRFLLVPVSLGLRYVLPSSFIRPYFGAGGDVYFYYETNPIGSVLNYAKGYHLLGGAYLQLGKDFPILINVRMKYTLVKASQNGRSIDLGGLEYGAGIGLVF